MPTGIIYTLAQEIKRPLLLSLNRPEENNAPAHKRTGIAASRKVNQVGEIIPRRQLPEEKVIRASDSSLLVPTDLFSPPIRGERKYRKTGVDLATTTPSPRRAHIPRLVLAIPISLVTAASCLAAQSYLPSNLPAPAVHVIPRGCARLR